MRKAMVFSLMLLFCISVQPMTVTHAATPPVVYVSGDGSGDYNCDGTSDQVEINQALDFVAADPNYTTVHLKGPHTYWIDEPIYISANTILEGDSDAVVKLIDHAGWNTQYKPLIGQKGLTFTFQLGDPDTTTGNITIRGFEIDGNRDHQSEPSGNSFYNAIRLQNCYNITINDMYMHHNLADMVQVINDEAGFDINSQFYNNRIHKNGHDAFFFGFADNFQVFNNDITNHRTDAGVRTDACNHFQIYNNIIGNDPDRDPSGGAAIEMYAWGPYPVNDVEIYGNYLYGNGYYHGIWLRQRDDDNPAGTLHTHENVHIHHNIISWYQLAGISITGFHNTLIENNVIELNGDGGVVFYGGDPVDPTVSGFQTILKNNIIVNNSNYGIDNRAPDVHAFVSDHNDVYRNSLGSYHNASSTADIHVEPEFAYQDAYYYDTYGNNTYSILSPAWQSAIANQDFTGDLGANEAWQVYHPRSQNGRWDGSQWVDDMITSQCIDMGDPASDFSNEPLPNGGRINLGAFGNTAYASKSADATDNVITYSLDNNRVYRVAAQPNATPEDVSAALDALSSGSEDHLLNVSPNGQWLVLETDRFGCSGWPCLAVVKADFSSGGAVTIDGGVVHPEGSISAISNNGDLVVYASQDGPHATDLYASVRSSGVWGAATLLTGSSTYNWHSMPALSADASTVLFDCDNDQSDVGEAICEAPTDGTGFRVVLTPADGPGPQYNPLHSPDYAPDGSIVFEGDWDGETIWRLPAGSTTPVKVGGHNNDNSPCVLPDGSIASLWMDRPGGPSTHELKVMRADGASYFMALTDVDVYDVGIGCGGPSTQPLYLPIIISSQTANTVRLSWDDDAAYTHYDIWRDTAPYFTPGAAPYATVTPPPNYFDDAGALGDPATNYFYLVEGQLATSGSLFSRRLGEFDFGLTPGGP